MTRLIGVDVGGTFTDVMAVDEGRILAAKVPTNPDASEVSVLEGARQLQVDRASVFNLASTAGLNAVITRRLPKVGFLTTIGHRDILDRGRLWRPLEALTDASWRRSFGDTMRPLVPRYLRRGIVERLTADGEVYVPLDEDQAQEQLRVFKDCGVEGVAICLLHSYVNPVHEQRLLELTRDVLGDVVCSISSAVSPLAKEYHRASTTLIDVLMKLKYTAYNERLQRGLEELGFKGEFNYADCSAMLLPAAYAMDRPHQLVMGGPAAGTVASAHFGSYIKKPNLLCADVGGTSCDISVVLNGRPWVNTTFELEWDMLVSTLTTEVVTLGAGGGSIVSIGRTGEILSGPDSAGAVPGPACYGKGGNRPTITDAALSAGILAADRFLGGKVPLYPDLATAAFEQLDSSLDLSARIRQAWAVSLNNVAEGIFDITIRRGLDVRDFSLLAFGAAGPMLLPGLLELLPLESVVVPPNPGGFSAVGLLSANRVFSDTRTRYGLIDVNAAPEIDELYQSLEEQLLERAGGLQRAGVTIRRTFDARVLGQGWETPFVPAPNGTIDKGALQEMITAFHAEYKQRSGNSFPHMAVEGVSFRVQLEVPSPTVDYDLMRISQTRDADEPPVIDTVMIRHMYDDDIEANCYNRDDLIPGDVLAGPSIIYEDLSTTFVPFGCSGVVGDYGEITIR